MSTFKMENDTFRIMLKQLNFKSVLSFAKAAKFTNSQKTMLNAHKQSFPKLHNLTTLNYRLQFTPKLPKNPKNDVLYQVLEKSYECLVDNNIYRNGDLVMFKTYEGSHNEKKHGIIVTTNGKKTIVSDERFGLHFLPKKAFNASKGKNYDHLFEIITKNMCNVRKSHYEKRSQALHGGTH